MKRKNEMSEWKKVKLGDYIKEINEKTTENNQYEVLTSSRKGIYSQEEYFDKQVASKNNIGYKIIKKGQFTYRSMSDNGIFIINRLENKNIGIVSPAYPVFEVVKMNSKYLKHFFQSEEFKKLIYNLSQGSTRTALKYKDLSSIEIMLPPIEEQEKIVKILENVDNIINRYEKLLKEKEQFIKSQFVEMFGECKQKVKLKDVISFLSRGKSPQYVDNSEIGIINQACIYWNEIKYKNIKFQDPDKIKKDCDKWLKTGDILITSTGTGTLGRCNIYQEENDKFIADSHVSIMRVDKNNINPQFFKYYFMQEQIQKELYASCVSGSTNQIELSRDKFLKFDILVAPIELQNQFAEFVQVIDKQKVKLEKQISNYKDLKKGLMQQLLTGKVKVKI